MKIWSKTRTGRIVYERPRHFFTARDVLRISTKLEKRLRDAPRDDLEREIVVLITVIDNISEYMLAILLSRFGASIFANDVLASMKNIVDRIRIRISAYYGKPYEEIDVAPGPFSIPY